MNFGRFYIIIIKQYINGDTHLKLSEFLTGKKGGAVLFEPYISKTNTETLIWRRGRELWDRAEHYFFTQLSLAERCLSDCVIIDLNFFGDSENKEKLISLTASADYVGKEFCVICGNRDESELCECMNEKGNARVDVLGLYENAASLHTPSVRMDGTVEEAVKRGESGYFVRSGIRSCIENYGNDIRLLGGLGAEFISSSKPASIYAEIDEIFGVSGGNWAIGSGGEIPADNYLQLISLLGAYLRLK